MLSFLEVLLGTAFMLSGLPNYGHERVAHLLFAFVVNCVFDVWEIYQEMRELLRQ